MLELSFTKTSGTLSQSMQVFYVEETIHQFGVGKYRIGLYFPRYKLTIECDEFDHRDRDFGYEVERLKHIEKLFNCTFVRFNPDAKDFGILEVVNRIFVQIKSFFFRLKICSLHHGPQKCFKHTNFFFGGEGLTPIHRSTMTSPGPKIIIKMSSVVPFTFNAVQLCVVTINEKPRTRAREVCRALEYQKGRARDVLKKHVSIESKQHKHELEGPAAVARV